MKRISKIQSASNRAVSMVSEESRLEQRVDVIKRVLLDELPPDCLTDEDVVLMQELVMDAVVRKKALSSEMAFGGEDSPLVH